MWHSRLLVRCQAAAGKLSGPARRSSGTSGAAGKRPGKTSGYSGSSSSSSSFNNNNNKSGSYGGSKSSSSSGRPPGGRTTSSSSSGGGGRPPGSRTSTSSSSSSGSSSGVRRDGPPRARDILLKPKRPAPAGEPAAAAPQRPMAEAVFPAGPSGALADDPTFVPRDPAVQDGPWGDVDAQLVLAAQRDAEQQQRQQQDEGGAQGAPPSSSSSSQQVDPQGLVLLGQSREQLAALAQQLGQARFRGQQMQDGLLRGARSVADLPGLPAAFRAQLAELGVRTGRSVVHHSVAAPDGTRKLLLQLEEGRVVEAVGIPSRDERGRQRLTVCVSSQVGCPMRCTFCATGKGGFARNLRAHEIVDQVMTVSEEFGQRASNVVFMGMGEPLLNLPGVVAAAGFMRDQLGLSGRSITISTVGVPNAIARLAEHRLTATLAVSIHAPNQALREALIPSARAYPLQALMQDCVHYFKATGRRVTFEYTLLGGTNDSPTHAEELAALLKRSRLMSHVNLIPWNPVDESGYKRPGGARVKAFQGVLEAAGVPVSVRTTRGLEAAAACGQLRNQFQKAGLEQPRPLT